MCDGEKVYDVFQILHDEFQIPVHLDLLLKIKEIYFFFLTVLLLHLLAALAFQGKTLRGHFCLPASHVWNCNFVSFPNHLYTKSFHEWLPL